MEILLVGPAAQVTENLRGALESTGDLVHTLVPGGEEGRAWNPRSPLSTKSVLIELKSEHPDVEEVWILGPWSPDESTSSSETESTVDLEVKGLLYLTHEATTRFPSAHLRFLQPAATDTTPIHLACHLAFRGVVDAFMADGRATGYRSQVQDADAFFSFVIQTRGDSRKQGKWHVQKGRGGLFGSSRN